MIRVRLRLAAEIAVTALTAVAAIASAVTAIASATELFTDSICNVQIAVIL